MKYSNIILNIKMTFEDFNFFMENPDCLLLYNFFYFYSGVPDKEKISTNFIYENTSLGKVRISKALKKLRDKKILFLKRARGPSGRFEHFDYLLSINSVVDTKHYTEVNSADRKK